METYRLPTIWAKWQGKASYRAPIGGPTQTQNGYQNGFQNGFKATPWVNKPIWTHMTQMGRQSFL